MQHAEAMRCDRLRNMATSMCLLARPLFGVPSDVAAFIAGEEPWAIAIGWGLGRTKGDKSAKSVVLH
jgi:hypothetical protein